MSPTDSRQDIPKASLAGRRILVAVSGGIAAFRAVDLCSRLRKSGAETRVAMTPAAAKFVAPLTFEAITGSQATVDMFSGPRAWEMDHIADARWAELVVVAPATANIIAKLAHGLADCPVSTLCLAYQGPLMVCPAMNTAMFQHPATAGNLAALKSRGALIVGPGDGRLACGESGPGRLAEIDDIYTAIEDALCGAGPLKGMKVLVTAGPTREFIDPARFISNPSTGKMGYALAQEAARRGASVTLVSGPTDLAPPAGVEMRRIVSTAELLAAVKKEFKRSRMAIFAAAPADYRPARPALEKQPKKAGGKMLELEGTEDVAKWAGENRTRKQILVGFAAETGDGKARAVEKMNKKSCDFIVLNDISRGDIGFASDENEVLIISRDGAETLIPKQSKQKIASAILDRVAVRTADK